jgi:putative transposase
MAAFKKTLALQNENYRNGGKFTSQFAMEKHLTAWRNSPDTPWLRNSPRSAQIKAIEDLDRAFKNFFEKRAGFPMLQAQGPVSR